MFNQGLKEIGYVVGRNVTVESRESELTGCRRSPPISFAAM
jgi:hypothetical protein